MAIIPERASDKQLRDAILRQLEWQPEIESKDISVRADQGLVTLTGFVHTYPERLAAEKASKSVYGVKAVANDIEVKTMTRTDPEIARDILEAIRLDLTIPDDLAKVTVRAGLVTLEGVAEWHFQREAAERCARNVIGVRSLINQIQIKPQPSTGDVRLRIEEALRRSAEVDARRIDVSLHDGAVTLSGNVHSWFEKEEAHRAAWAAPGVSRVIDHISVVP